MRLTLSITLLFLWFLANKLEAAQIQALQGHPPTTSFALASEYSSQLFADSSNAHQLTDKAEQAMEKQIAEQHKSSGELSLELGHSANCSSRVLLSLIAGNERTTESRRILLCVSAEYTTLSNSPYTATISAFGGGVLYRRYFQQQPSTFYMVGRASLFVCVEDYGIGTKQQSTRSIGPRLSQAIGYRLANTMDIEFGIYGQLLMGSSLLPNDLGFFAAIGFTL